MRLCTTACKLSHSLGKERLQPLSLSSCRPTVSFATYYTPNVVRTSLRSKCSDGRTVVLVYLSGRCAITKSVFNLKDVESDVAYLAVESRLVICLL